MLGRTISHYRISGQLGAGGMGVVYAGEDLRLGRSVALKFVPEDVANDSQAVERLRAEARAASALNHSNICTIYDVGEHEGRPFIVMELLKGQTLRDVLTGGPLKIHQVVDIGIQVADALDAAHASGIIHRDIKPANLFLADRGVVKILDFGLAKQLPRLNPSGATTTGADLVTAEGVTVGTVSYMSPEQVTGEQLDGRTDLFSLGIVLYECATGHRPFTGKTSALVFSAILNQSPAAPMALNPQIPSRLQDAIHNCLEKDRELRYQDAAGLRADLKRLRRDLESGHSQSLKAVSVSSHLGGSASARQAGSGEAGTRDTASPWLRGRVIWGAALAAAGALALTSYWLWPRVMPPSPVGTVVESSPGPDWQNRLELAATRLRAGSYREALADAEAVLQAVPEESEARRIRDEARAAIARFDEAIARGNRLVAGGDADGASAALSAARAVDPNAPAVTELSERILGQYRVLATRDRQRGAEPLRPPAPSPLQTAGGRSPSGSGLVAPSPEPGSTPTAGTSSAAAAAAPPSSASVASQAVPPPAGAAPAESSPRPLPRPPTSDPVAPPVQAARPADAAGPGLEPSARGAAGNDRPAVEDDELLIRRLMDTWARAIEAKDLALYRSVKPNLSADEQRRIEAGFRAVSSQQVGITILGIERRGQQAVVRLRRRDTFVADGRQQTRDTQQTVTVVRSASGWVISEIGL